MKIKNDAQAVIVKKDDAGKISFLIIKRFDIEKQLDHYRLVKGGVEKDETSKQTVIREVREEVGIKEISEVEFLCGYEFIGGNVKHEVDVFIVLVSDEDSETIVDSTHEGGFQIKSAEWVSAEEALSKLTFEEEKRLIVQAVAKLSV